MFVWILRDVLQIPPHVECFPMFLLLKGLKYQKNRRAQQMFSLFIQTRYKLFKQSTLIDASAISTPVGELGFCWEVQSAALRS